MAELHPELAKATATTALQFLASFDNEDFGIMREDSPGPHDRRHLALALDYIQELGAMVLNLADRVPPNAELCGARRASEPTPSCAASPYDLTLCQRCGHEAPHHYAGCAEAK